MQHNIDIYQILIQVLKVQQWIKLIYVSVDKFSLSFIGYWKIDPHMFCTNIHLKQFTSRNAWIFPFTIFLPTVVILRLTFSNLINLKLYIIAVIIFTFPITSDLFYILFSIWDSYSVNSWLMTFTHLAIRLSLYLLIFLYVNKTLVLYQLSRLQVSFPSLRFAFKTMWLFPLSESKHLFKVSSVL